jgi:hypothetical protein
LGGATITVSTVAKGFASTGLDPSPQPASRVKLRRADTQVAVK